MRRLLLLGGGHTHLHVLRALAKRRIDGAEVVLVSASASQHYSGMYPGFIQGTYDAEELAIPLGPLCARAGVRFIEARAESVDVAARRVVLPDASLPFDVLSLDVGGSIAGLEVPGAREHAWTLRPWSRALALGERLDRLARASAGGAVAVVIVGGGAGGVEVAFAVHRRLRAAGAAPAITVVESAADVLPEFPGAAQALARRLLVRRGIAVRTGARVERVDVDGVRVGGAPLAGQLVIWAAGAAPPELFGRSRGLPLDAAGYLTVDDSLRATDGAPVWGAGDCVTLTSSPAAPKAGVVAVRQGPVLAHNLVSAVTGGRPRRFALRASYLAILDTADRRALLRWGALVVHARWAWRLKQWIDRRFVRPRAGDGP